jgi:transketolase
MSDNQITTLQHKILKILLDETSENKRMTGHVILNRIGIAKFGTSHVMKNLIDAINVLREHGHPVCHSSTGYFYARRNESVLTFINSLKNKIELAQQLLQVMEKTYPNVGGLSADLKPKAKIAVKTGNDTVKIMLVDMDENGEPIIPKGVETI